MIVALDVDYGDAQTRTALVAFARWTDTTPAHELVELHPGAPAEYRPGHFFERELPHLLAILGGFAHPIDAVVIDGYVTLGDRDGLGMHLHRAIARPVVGVAKTRFASATAAEVIRGGSTRPLYVTDVGVPDAAARIAAMHGEYRIPTLLKRADSLARGHATPAAAATLG